MPLDEMAGVGDWRAKELHGACTVVSEVATMDDQASGCGLSAGGVVPQRTPPPQPPKTPSQLNEFDSLSVSQRLFQKSRPPYYALFSCSESLRILNFCNAILRILSNARLGSPVEPNAFRDDHKARSRLASSGISAILPIKCAQCGKQSCPFQDAAQTDGHFLFPANQTNPSSLMPKPFALFQISKTLPFRASGIYDRPSYP